MKSVGTAVLSNAEIANRLTSLAHLLAAQGENPFKVRAYRRAADTIRALGESVDELVRADADLTHLPGIGDAIAGAIREIVETGSLRKLETLRSTASPELAALSEHPRLDPRQVLRVYRKLSISSVDELREKLASGEIGGKLGPRVEHHVRQGLTEAREILLYDADAIVPEIRRFLLEKCGVIRAEVAGEVRRRVEVIGEISFLIETPDFAGVRAQLARFGGRTELIRSTEQRATFRLSSGVLLTVENAAARTWGLALIAATGADAHVAQLERRGLGRLTRSRDTLADEETVYRKLGLRFIAPELREGLDEIALAAKNRLPELVTLADIRGELHAHTTASDGAHTIEQMAAAARERGYRYLGITDHSQSLKIAGGLSETELAKQIRRVDALNKKLSGFRILKSAEVDIRIDGTLDYPDALLRRLDYTICSIHSRFALGKQAQTERLLRAMDNRHFTILGHATGRLLLRRPGYEIDLERVIAHARQRGCFFEINASPDRLDLRAEHARLAREAGVKIAVCTDAHSIRELDYLRCGIDQARRAGLRRQDVLNCLTWSELRRVFKRT